MWTATLPLLWLLAAPNPNTDPSASLRRGTELYKAGVYDKAALAFEEAWTLAPTPTTALNLAQSLEGAGRPAEALGWYARVIAGEAPGQPRRLAAESGQAHLRAHGFLAITCGPPGAQLTVGPNTGQCPTWGGYLPAGRQSVSLSASDRAPFSGEVVLVAGERREMTLDLAREASAPVAAANAPASAPTVAPAGPGVNVTEPVASTPPAAPIEPAVPAWVAYTLLGVGGAAVVLGGIYYSQAADAADKAPTGPSRTEVARRESLQSEFETDSTVGYAGLGGGAALLLGGGALLLFGGHF